MSGAERFGSWIAAYERAWRTPDTASLADIFTADARYLAGPFEEPLVGLEAIATFWESERDGPDETFALNSELVAVDGSTGVVRAEVIYGEPPRRPYRDLWVITLDADDRCSAFEEWPFHAGQPLAAP